MSTRTAELNARTALALDQIEVSDHPWRARVADRTLAEDSDRHLVTALAGAVYDIVHAGRERAEGAQPKSLRDPGFEQVLEAQVPHAFSWVHRPAVEVLGPAGVVVAMDGLRVLVPADAQPDGTRPEIGAPVRFRMPATRPAASPGFLLVHSESGTLDLAGRDLLRLYLHLPTPDAAPAAWGAVLRALHELNAPYQAKVASARRFYPRRDALVVYLDHTAPRLIPSLVAALSPLRLGAEVSAFAEPLAAGIGCAWEPRDPRAGYTGMSLGQHRSRVVAEALVAHAAGRTDPDRRRAVADAFRAANIDPVLPHRNLDTPDAAPQTS